MQMDNLVKEDFSNVFDSSLVDYSYDFAKADERYKKEQKIKKWLLNNTNFVGIKNFIKEDKIKINDDYSIDIPLLRCYNKMYFYREDKKFPDFIKFNDVKTLCINSEMNDWNILSNLPKHIETVEIITGSLKENEELAILLFKYSDVKKIYLYNNGEWYYSAHDIDRRIHESFENIFDSSLVNYSKDFEDQDKQCRINQIKEWLDKYEIKKYTINDDLMVDVDGNVYLGNHREIGPKLEVQFNKVNGNFDCCNCLLTTLEGCPKYVSGLFECASNDLNSLEYGPKEVGKYYSCTHNKLTSFKGSPNKIGGNFYCAENQFTSLEGCPKEIGGNFWFDSVYSDNPYAKIIRSKWSQNDLRSISNIKGKIIGLWYKVSESFDNVFDSSLIDYSKDFEEQDKILYQDRCDKINKWLSDMRLIGPDEDGKERTYKINSDFTIDASGHIDIDSIEFEEIGIPEYIQFNEVWGSFHISFCDHLQNPIINPKVAERGAVGFGPKIVHGKYWVSYNNELEDLRGCPEIVEGEFVCIHNSWLKTFEYFPKRVEGDFTYYSNGLELDYEGTLYDGRIGNGWTPERLRNTYYIGGKIDDGNYYINKKEK